jgi:hypothetical protein
MPVFGEECIWVVHEKPQANCAHLVLELKLHVELDRVPSKSDVIRRIGFVSKRELKAKSLRVELDRALYVASAYNRVRLFEHKKIQTRGCKRMSGLTSGSATGASRR